MIVTKQEREEVAKTKALAKWVADQMPSPQLPIHKVRYPKQRTDLNQIRRIEQSYDQLDGEWLEWLEVAKRYEHKVPSQDRYDIRHCIMMELAKARQRDGQPIPALRAYRIASLTVALYWREQARHQVKVCIYNGLPTEPYCATCRHKPKIRSETCPYLALRPIQSLDSELGDDEGNTVALKETVADDKAIDLDLQLDASTWLLGCPMRLVQIARKRLDGIPLDNKDKCYLQRFRQKEQKRLL